MVFIDEYGYSIFFPSNKFKIKGIKNKIISFIPLTKIFKIKLKGVKYSLNNNLKLGNNISLRNYAIKNKININYKYGEGIIFISHKKYINKFKNI